MDGFAREATCFYSLVLSQKSTFTIWKFLWQEAKQLPRQGGMHRKGIQRRQVNAKDFDPRLVQWTKTQGVKLISHPVVSLHDVLCLSIKQKVNLSQCIDGGTVNFQLIRTVKYRINSSCWCRHCKNLQLIGTAKHRRNSLCWCWCFKNLQLVRTVKHSINSLCWC